MDNSKIGLILLLGMLLSPGMAFALDETVLFLTLEYDEEITEMELTEITTIYGYVSPDMTPGNATIRVLSENGEELHSVRVGLVSSGLLITPPEIDEDTNIIIGNEEIETQAFTAWIGVPFMEGISKIEVMMDENPTFEFWVAERLCNKNGKCEGEETVFSCADCKASDEDGACKWDEDGFCDPDCLIGVDPDCLEKTPGPEPTSEATAAPTLEPTDPEPTQGNGDEPEPEGFSFTLILAGAGIIAVVIIAVYVKTMRS